VQVEANFNYSSDAIIVSSVEGEIDRVNTAFSSLFGYQPDQSLHLSLFALVATTDQDLLRGNLQQAAASRQSTRIEIVLHRKDNSLFDADVAISPIQESDFQGTGLICSVRDITERKRMEVELRKALEQERELSELKSRFVATASHEFRTPLSMIMTASELLQKYNHRMNDEQKTERLERIQIEVKNMARLLDDVLTVNKSVEVSAMEFDPVPVNVVDFCSYIVEEARVNDHNQHHFEMYCTGDYTLVNLDPKFMRDVLVNLLSNATKYSPLNAKIALQLICEQRNTVILVQDQGIGISEDDQKRLFQAFHRGKNVGQASGTGLGLTIARQAAELHGGTITVESKVGLGTTFTVTIPNGIVEDRNYDHQNSSH
jgi:PAS domain S-box-containing protein